MATAAIGAGTSLLSGILGSKGAKSAAKAQAQAINRGIDVQNQQFQQERADSLPFLQAGQGALGQTQGLLGLQGNDIQSQLIAALKGSPAFTSLYDTGADTILQNAAATGGLRGGNTQNSLAQFGSGLLATVIQNQLQNLGGLVNIGSGTAGQLGAMGQNSANAISDLLVQGGNAKATGIAGQTAAWQGVLNGVGNAAGNFASSRGW